MNGQIDLFDEIIVDNFAGGGGASTGIELATGRPVNIAINHDPDAILMHKTNHPYTEHYQASVWDINPEDVWLGHWQEIRTMLNEYTDWNLNDNEIIVFNIDGTEYFIYDIGMRMLQPKELYAAQGFPKDYVIEKDYLGNTYPKSKQVARCGNAVPPPFATALVRANLPEYCDTYILTMADLMERMAI